MITLIMFPNIHLYSASIVQNNYSELNIYKVKTVKICK